MFKCIWSVVTCFEGKVSLNILKYENWKQTHSEEWELTDEISDQWKEIYQMGWDNFENASTCYWSC